MHMHFIKCEAMLRRIIKINQVPDRGGYLYA